MFDKFDKNLFSKFKDYTKDGGEGSGIKGHTTTEEEKAENNISKKQEEIANAFKSFKDTIKNSYEKQTKEHEEKEEKEKAENTIMHKGHKIEIMEEQLYWNDRPTSKKYTAKIDGKLQSLGMSNKEGLIEAIKEQLDK